MRRFPLLVLTLSLAAAPAFGWWEEGHEVVARIAASELTPAAQTRVARILGVPDTKEAVSNALAVASIWADQTKNETKTGEWHYIDLTLQDHKDDGAKRCPDGNCLPDQITHFEDALKEGTGEPGSRWSEADELRYLVHFVGDSVQPLHTISDADAGGNCEKLDPAFEKAKNLHALWDGGIIGAIGENDRVLARQLETEIDGMSRRQRRKLTRGDVGDWIWESHEIALRDIYDRLHIPTAPPEQPKNCSDAPEEIRDFKLQVDPTYVQGMEPVVKLQLIKGGLRLATVLNEVL